MKNLNQHDRGPRHRHPIRYIFFSGLVISALSVYLTRDWANIGNLASDNKDIKATQIPSPNSAYTRLLPSAAPAIAGEVVQPTSPLTAADPQQPKDSTISMLKTVFLICRMGTFQTCPCLAFAGMSIANITVKVPLWSAVISHTSAPSSEKWLVPRHFSGNLFSSWQPARFTCRIYASILPFPGFCLDSQ
jgi:hypothetical protein